MKLLSAIAAAIVAAGVAWQQTGELGLGALGAFAAIGAITVATFLFKLWWAVPADMALEEVAERERVEHNLAILRAPAPDMSFQELFLYLDPDVLNSETKAWLRVGRAVQDALSIGRLKCWGRLVGAGSAQARDIATLRDLSPDIWATGQFTYWFLAGGLSIGSHFLAKEDVLQTREYTDLQVNRRQVEQVWPKPLALTGATP